MDKRKKGEQRQGTCTYCGAQGPVTKDHIPPRCLFGDGVPQDVNLVTVPCCDRCNGKYSKLDEKFKFYLVGSWRTGGTLVADELCQTSIARSLKRSQSKGLWAGVLEQAVPVEVRTRSGLYVCQSLALHAEDMGVPDVVDRIVRGLYWKDYMGEEARLPDDHSVRISGRSADFAKASQHGQTIVAAVCKNKKVIHPQVFRYGYAGVEDAPAKTVWFLKFYDAPELAAVTGPNEFWEELQGR